MTPPIGLKIARLPHGGDLPLPAYKTTAAAGADLVAAVSADRPHPLAPGERGLIGTGLVLAIPVGYEGQIRPRSGLALSDGLTVLNAPGTIDADYRGEVKVLLVNLGGELVMIERGMRIAQLVISRVTTADFSEVDPDQLDQTERGTGGFGSTGRTA